MRQFIIFSSLFFLLPVFLSAPLMAQRSGKKLSRKDRALHNAVRNWNLPQVKRALSQGANVNSKNSSGFSPIFLAAPGRDEGRRAISRLMAITRYLLRRRANPNVRDKKGNSALHHCIRINCSFAYVKLLVRAKANINAKDARGRTILALALNRKRRDIVSLLKRRGARVSLKQPKTVYEAVKFENFTALKKLIDGGADVNRPFIDGGQQKNYALGLAVANKNVQFTKYLLKKGAKDNLVDLLYLAVANAQINMAQVLIKAGAKINGSGRPAIFAAFDPPNRTRRHFKMLQWLIARKANVNEIHSNKGHLLDVAAISTNRIPMYYVKFILRKGAYLDGQSHGLDIPDDKIPFNKRSPLEKSVAFGGNARLALLLIKKGANPKIHQNFVLQTLAAGPANLSILKALRRKHVNLKTKFENNKTILHLAAPGYANVYFFRYAIRAGVNWRARDKFGKTAYDYVKQRQRPGKRAIIRYLRRLGAR